MKKNSGSDRKSGLGRLYRALWHYAAEQRRLVLVFMGMLVLAQGIKLSFPYFTAQAVNALQLSGLDGLGQAARNMALLFGACVLSWVLHGPGRVIERFVAVRIRERFSDALYTKAAALPMDWHESHHSGETIQRIGKASNALFGFSQNQFVYLQNLVTLVGPIAALFLISVETGLVALVSYVLIAAVLIRFDAMMVRLNLEQNQAERRYSAALVDCLGNVATVLALSLQDATRRLVGARLAEVFVPLRRSIVVNEAKWCAIDLMNSAVRCGLVVLYGWLAYRQDGTVLLGTAVMVYQYAQQTGGVVSSMAGNYQDLVRYQTDFVGAEEILTAARRAPAGGFPIPAGWREIRIDGLGFAYANRRGEAAALRDIGLDLRRGERIAVVGGSGSGKSTLLRLLAGLYAPDQVAIRIDGALRPDLADLGAIATLIPQDPEVFETSIGHNITLGLDHPDVEVRRACDLAGLTPVVDALPAGLDTVVAERGLNLSGGQKQRLALARGILAARDSSLLMLDEPTSSMDPETELRIYDRLFAAFPDACLISSIHRLHLLPRFDRIVLMEGGRLLDIGSMDDLLVRQPAFRAMWLSYGTGTEMRPDEDASIAA